MSEDTEIFLLSPELNGIYQEVAPGAWAVLFDRFYAHPRAVRDLAINSKFQPSTQMYPGEHSRLPEIQSVTNLKNIVLNIVNSHLLPRMRISHSGRILNKLESIETDFSIITTRPENLLTPQKQPHTDPVPIFGIVYLNDPPQGGTIFFQKKESHEIPLEGKGYIDGGDGSWTVASRLEPRFNRLVLYPGFIPHSGEIKTNWKDSELDKSNLRLTQRFMLFP